MFRRFSPHVLTILMLVLLYLPGWVGFGASKGILSQSRQLLYAILFRLPLMVMALRLSLSGGSALRRVRGWKTPTGRDFLLMLGLPVLTLSVGTLFRSETPSWPEMEGTVLILFLSLSITTVVSEELLFRSWILSEYKNTVNRTALVLTAALLFAGTHTWQGVGPTMFAFAVGVLYSLVFLRRPNIWILLGAHSIHNTLAIILANIR